MEYSLCIVTPLYNRKKFLPAVGESLENQTRKDFQWLVIDDGSTEKSESELGAFREKSLIFSEYYYKENGGKHTALNFSHPYIKADWVLILDSDDTLTADAVETACRYIEKYKDNEKIGVISFPRMYPDGKAMCDFANGEIISDAIEYRINAGRAGDCCEVIRTSVLKEFEFPTFEGENFLDEAHLWVGSADKYKTAYINKPIYVCAYQEGGLTSQGVGLRRRNPLGGIHTQIVGLNPRCSFKYRLKRALLLVYFGKLAKKSMREIRKMSPCPGFVGLFTPLGLIFYKYREWKFKKSEK